MGEVEAWSSVASATLVVTAGVALSFAAMGPAARAIAMATPPLRAAACVRAGHLALLACYGRLLPSHTCSGSGTKAMVSGDPAYRRSQPPGIFARQRVWAPKGSTFGVSSHCSCCHVSMATRIRSRGTALDQFRPEDEAPVVRWSPGAEGDKWAALGVTVTW